MKSTIFIMLLLTTTSYHVAAQFYAPGGTVTSTAAGNTNVGIGTTNAPAEKLTVKGNVRIEGVDNLKQFSNLSFYRYATPSQPFATIGFGDPTQPNTTFDISEHNGNAIRFMQGTSERVRITSAGDMGIGMNAPDARLSLQAAAPGNLITMKATNSTALLKMGLTTGYAWIQSSGPAPLRINDSGNDVLFNIGGGNVGIGTSITDAKLTVRGTIHTQEVRVDLNVPGPDYVFEKNYNLPTLSALENYINQNKHLPEVPSAKEMEANGVKLGEMNMLLLKKVEELTLYVIELKKQIDLLKKENAPEDTATK
jgi:hypothetical protein